MALTIFRKAAMRVRAFLGLPPIYTRDSAPALDSPCISLYVSATDDGGMRITIESMSLVGLEPGRHDLYLNRWANTSIAEPDYIADAARVMAWMQQDPRPSPQAAFTAGPERQAAYWAEIGACTLKEIAAELRVGEAIHYPEDWDTAAYPTVWSALSEVVAWAGLVKSDGIPL